MLRDKPYQVIWCEAGKTVAFASLDFLASNDDEARGFADQVAVALLVTQLPRQLRRDGSLIELLTIGISPEDSRAPSWGGERIATESPAYVPPFEPPILKKEPAGFLYTAHLKSVGNPDFQQYASVSEPTWMGANTLEDVQKQVRNYIAFWNLGGGNWVNSKLRQGGKVIGEICYNGRIKDRTGKFLRE